MKTERAVFSFAMKEKGFISTLILTLLVVAAGLFIWFYLKNNQPYAGTFLESLFVHTIPPNTTGWKTFNDAKLGITMQIPPNWYNYDNKYVSEYPFSPTIENSNDIYNGIEVSIITNQEHLGYSNSSYFWHIYNLPINGSFHNEYYGSDRAVNTLLDKGNILSGQAYAVFKTETTKENYYAEVAINETIYKFELINPNDEGIKMFENIIKTVSISAS